MDPLAALMGQYDRRFPHATPFERSSYRFECQKVLDDLHSAGLTIVAGAVAEA